MPDAHFAKGVDNIRRAIDETLADREVAGATVDSDYVASAEPRTVEFCVSVGGKTAKQKFTPDEINDSGQAIDHNCAMHVRNLVSQFVR